MILKCHQVNRSNSITWDQFHNDVDRLSLCAHAYKFDNIGVIILLENSRCEKKYISFSVK